MSTLFTKKNLTLSVSVVSGIFAMQAASLSAHAKDIVTLPKTVVTASRISTPLHDIIGDVTIIDSEKLATHAGQTLVDVLKNTPGIQWKQNGSTGTTSSISLRGAGTQSTLVLIDGIRYGSATVGQAAFENLPADQIERVEVLYGSAATSLYGADAIGGVVQIFTKAATQRQNTLSATLGVGTQDTQLVSGTFNVGNRHTRFGMAASNRSTQGISATNPNVSFGYEPDKDGNSLDSVSAGLSHKFTNGLSVGANALQVKSLVDFDAGDPKGESRNQNKARNATIWGKYAITDGINASLQYGASTDENNGAYSAFKTAQRQAKAQLDAQLPAGKLLAGAERLQQEVSASTAFTTSERETNSLLLGYQFAEKYLQGQFNVRQDDVSGYGNETTYSAGLAVEPINGIRIGGSYATGLRAPTFSDLYYPYQKFSSGYEYQGNPDLKPETSENAEVFFAIDTGNVTSRISLYQNKIENLIGNGPLANGVNSRVNINQATLEGASWKTDWAKDSLIAGAHYDFLKATDDKTGKRLRNRAKHAGGVYAGLAVQDKLTVRGEVDYVGLRFDDALNTKRLDGYTLFNLATTVKLSPYVDGSLRWNNVFGTDYETVGGYNTLGANALASITIHNKY